MMFDGNIFDGYQVHHVGYSTMNIFKNDVANLMRNFQFFLTICCMYHMITNLSCRRLQSVGHGCNFLHCKFLLKKKHLFLIQCNPLVPQLILMQSNFSMSVFKTIKISIDLFLRNVVLSYYFAIIK